MNKWMLLRMKSRIVTACGLVALAVVTLAWANQAQAMGYPVGSEEALEASFFDPFSLMASPFQSSTIRSAPFRLPVSTATTVTTAAPTVPASTAYVPPVRVPYRPPLRSPSRPPF